MLSVATEIVVTDQFRDWYLSLDEKDADAIEFSVGLLEQFGVALGAPHSSRIVGTALRELRVQSGGRPLRAFYAFDPKRQAVLLIGGDKTGDGRFYRKMIAEATALWNEYRAGK
jgi:hypothetical protein